MGRETQIIQRQVDHLARLVDDLLDVARITRGKFELKREHTEMSHVVARAVQLASVLIERRAHHLESRSLRNSPFSAIPHASPKLRLIG